MDTINKVVDALQKKDLEAFNNLIDNIKYFRS